MASVSHPRTPVIRTKPILAPGAQVLLSVPKEATPTRVNLPLSPLADTVCFVNEFDFWLVLLLFA
jgi:hypothetical protein